MKRLATFASIVVFGGLAVAATAVPPVEGAPAAPPAQAVRAGGMTVRLKDIAHIQGARDNQLIGYGIVVGLNGTGDTSEAVSDIVKNFLERLEVTIDSDDLEAKNVAIVTVTATLPAFARPGMRVDCLVSSLADAKSLQGGVLLQTSGVSRPGARPPRSRKATRRSARYPTAH